MVSIGRGNWPRLNVKPLVEDCLRLDVNRLAEHGILFPGSAGSISWPMPGVSRHSCSVSFEVTAERAAAPMLQISFAWNDSETIVQKISLHFTAPNFGGVRAWFLCPTTSSQTSCCRRCSKLYFHEGRFACRTCHNLAYFSQRKGRAFERLLKREGLDMFSRAEIREFSHRR